MAVGALIIMACAWYYWGAQAGEDVAPARTSVIIPMPIQVQLSDGRIFGARIALDLGAGSPLRSSSQGGSAFLSSDDEVERVQSIIKGYVALRGHEAFTGAGLARTRRELGALLAKSGLGVERLKFIDLTVLPPEGSWLLTS